MKDLDLVHRSLELRTSYSPQEALGQAKEAIERVGRVSLARAHVVGESEEELLVEIRPTSPVGILADNTTFVVGVRSDGEGTTVVSAEAAKYSVYQEKLFFFIPFGPKNIPGAKVFAKCLEEIEGSL